MIRLTIPFSVSLSFKNPCSLWANVEERYRVLSELGCGVSVCTLIHSEDGTTTCSAVLYFNQNFIFPAGFENVAVELHYAENSPGYRLFTFRDMNCLSAVNENLIGSVSTFIWKETQICLLNSLFNWLLCSVWRMVAHSVNLNCIVWMWSAAANVLCAVYDGSWVWDFISD